MTSSSEPPSVRGGPMYRSGRALRPPDGHRNSVLQNRGFVVRTIAGGRSPARPFRAAATTERVCTPKPTLIDRSSSSSVNALVATATPTRRPRSPDPQMRIGGAGRCPLIPCALARPAGRVLVPHDRRMARFAPILAVPQARATPHGLAPSGHQEHASSRLQVVFHAASCARAIAANAARRGSTRPAWQDRRP